MDFSKLVTDLRHTFRSKVTLDLNFRREQLKNFHRMLVENEKKIISALHQDLNKCEFETQICEITLVKNEVRLMLDNLSKWSKNRPVTRNLASLFDNVYTKPEPYGVVLIISAWNYPFYLTLTPLVGAIAAGNCAVIKPSELSPATSKLIEELVTKFLDQNCYVVVNGGKEETGALLNERFDKILYTGSIRVGKIVYQKAAEHLTPCVLELGGKSPCYVSDDVLSQIETVAKRISFGKTVCLGQTCVAPDYVLCSRMMQDKLVEWIPKMIAQNYGSSNPEDSNELCRIVNEMHFERLKNLIESSRNKIAVGGHFNKEKRWISPTILTNIAGDEPVMQEEIFGPILPIKVVENIDEAIEFINAREKPLSLYIFSQSEKVKNRILNETSSGSVCVNDTLLQLTIENLPFGGVGNSGMGSYHGQASFDTFSHEKSVMDHSMNPIVKTLEMSRYSPYTNLKKLVLSELLAYRWVPDLSYVTGILWFFVGLASAAFAQLFTRK